MADPAGLERLVHRVAAQIRRRRAEHYGLRGAFYGAVAAVVPLLAKGAIGAAAPAVAIALIVLGAGAGVVFGLALAAPRGDAARLADRAFGLEDRVATALEWTGRPDRTPVVDLLVQDAIERVERLESRQVVRHVLPREARLLPIPLAVVVALSLAPALPLPGVRMPDYSTASEEEAAKERAGKLQTSDRARATPENLKATTLDERAFERASATMARAGDRPALFKDTSLSGERPDFNSFLKKGDERLKLLEQMDSLPDLRSDFTQSQYKTMAQQSKALTAGKSPEQVPADKLRDLLKQMEEAGRKDSSEAGQSAQKGLKALEDGNTDKAMDAMNRALNQLRQSDEQRKGALNLSGGRQGDTGRRSTESGESQEQGNPEQEEPGTSKGKLPGKGPGTQPKGDPAARLGARGVDVSVEGEQGKGKTDSLETNMFGHAARVPSRLTTGSAFDQYRKMMEDAIAREQVPRDYQPQVKEYFRALGEK
jgi:hypothetical protein